MLSKMLRMSHDVVDACEFKFGEIIRSFLSSCTVLLLGSASDSDLLFRLVFKGIIHPKCKFCHHFLIPNFLVWKIKGDIFK